MISNFGLNFYDLAEGEQSCLREWIPGIDWAGAEIASFLSGLFSCIPGTLASRMVFGSGVGADLGFSPEEVSDEQLSCFRDRMANLDWEGLIDYEPAAFGEFASGLYSCAPELLIGILKDEFGLAEGDFGEEEVTCLGRWAAEFDWTGIFADDQDAPLGIVSGARHCIPSLTDSVDYVARG